MRAWGGPHSQTAYGQRSEFRPSSRNAHKVVPHSSMPSKAQFCIKRSSGFKDRYEVKQIAWPRPCLCRRLLPELGLCSHTRASVSDQLANWGSSEFALTKLLCKEHSNSTKRPKLQFEGTARSLAWLAGVEGARFEGNVERIGKHQQQRDAGSEEISRRDAIAEPTGCENAQG